MAPNPTGTGNIPEVRIHEDNPVSALIYAQLGTMELSGIAQSVTRLGNARSLLGQHMCVGVCQG